MRNTFCFASAVGQSLLGFALLGLGSVAYPQEPTKIESYEAAEHRIGSPSLIHSEAQLRPPRDSVTLHVIVDAMGNVESAQAVEGPQEFYDKAEKVEAKQKFKPFEKDGAAVRASFTDYVSIVPPEKWAETDVPFPEVKDWSSLRMGLKRTECLGPCPAYYVEVRGNGDVEFDGTSSVLIRGHHRSHISQEAVKELVAAFRQANYFSLKDKYITPVTDAPTHTTSIEFDGNKKSVEDYVGLSAGMPEIVTTLEDAIDRIAGTEKWTKGNAETGAALLAEGWDFSGDTEENRALFAMVVARGSQELIDLFVTHGAPALGITEEGQSALASAARNGNFELVKLMLVNQPKPPAALLSCALGEAARSGNVQLVEFLIGKGGDVNGSPCGKYDYATVLIKAAESGKAEIVSLLLAAGANANSRDGEGRTPLYYACAGQHPEVIRTLAAAGADVNAKDRNGQTILMSCFGNRGVKAMIDAGADLTIQNRFGHTAAEEARQMGARDKAELLESAMKERERKQ